MKFAVRSLRLKSNPLDIHIAKLVVLPDQRIRLESPRVGDDVMRPTGHSMQSPQRRDRRGAWTLHEMEGIHHNCLYPALLQICAINVAHYAQRGIRQESWES